MLTAGDARPGLDGWIVAGCCFFVEVVKDGSSS